MRRKYYDLFMVSLALITVLVIAAAATGGIFKPGEWYASLQKPNWTPPNWAFPVVWSLLYIAIAWSAWIMVRAEGYGLFMLVWVAQLVLNAAWSWLFFGKKRMDLAFIDVCGLWAAIALLIVIAWSVSTLAALLLVPYLVWVTIAGALNLTVWQMNRDAMPA